VENQVPEPVNTLKKEKKPEWSLLWLKGDKHAKRGWEETRGSKREAGQKNERRSNGRASKTRYAGGQSSLQPHKWGGKKKPGKEGGKSPMVNVPPLCHHQKRVGSLREKEASTSRKQEFHKVTINGAMTPLAGTFLPRGGKTHAGPTGRLRRINIHWNQKKDGKRTLSILTHDSLKKR